MEAGRGGEHKGLTLSQEQQLQQDLAGEHLSQLTARAKLREPAVRLPLYFIFK